MDDTNIDIGMWLITAQFRASRSKKTVRRPGVVFFRIWERGEFGKSACERSVNTDIHGMDSSVLRTEREAIVREMRLLYCVVERRMVSALPFSIDDVTEDFRRAIGGAPEMADLRDKSLRKFPLRGDWVAINHDLKDEFEFVFPAMPGYNGNLLDYICRQAQDMKIQGRISNSRNLLSLVSSLRNYAEGDEIAFSRVDARFVSDYADWLKAKEIRPSTQSFYLRALRVVLKNAAEEGLAEFSADWFRDVDTKTYRRDDSEAASPDSKLLLKLECKELEPELALARDMFMFGFYCGGMELVDVANLTLDNIEGNCLVYNRRMKGRQVRVPLCKQALRIISRYNGCKGRYLFPLLDNDGAVLFATLRNNVAQSLKTIGAAIGCPQLSFSMNIAAYNSLIAKINIPEMLLSHNALAL